MNDLVHEYLPSHNGNGNGNGHKEKAFWLTQPKSPEQIARENILASMPELRRSCSRDKRLKGRDGVGAKWLFSTLTDLSFLHSFGGNGFGIVQLSVKDLSRIFSHHKDSIARWRDLLIKHGWIWFADLWPKSQWGIMGVTKQPELLPMHSDYLRTAAKAARPTEQAGLHQNGKSNLLGQNGGSNGLDRPTEQAEPAYGVGQTGLPSRPNEPTQPAYTGPLSRTDRPTEQAEPGQSAGQSGLPSRTTAARRTGSLVETPIGVRSKEAIKRGKTAPPDAFATWEKSLEGRFASQLEKMRIRFIDQRKQASSDGKKLLQRKISKLDEMLDGPQPEWAGPKPEQPKPKANPVEDKPMSAAEILNGARYLVSLGKTDLLQPAQKDALKKAGEL